MLFVIDVRLLSVRLIISEPFASEGIPSGTSPKALHTFFDNVGRSSFLEIGSASGSCDNIALQQDSTKSFAVPIANAGSLSIASFILLISACIQFEERTSAAAEARSI